MPVNNRFCLAVLGLPNTFLFSDGWIGWSNNGKNRFETGVVQKTSESSKPWVPDCRSVGSVWLPGDENTVSHVQNATALGALAPRRTP